MNRRYQVFVSSTYEDLQEERAEAIQALLELDCMPAGMELFPAANEQQWNWIRRITDESDYGDSVGKSSANIGKARRILRLR